MFGRNGEAPRARSSRRARPPTASTVARGGGPHRGHLPHAGAAAVGRLDRQRVRAVADARRRPTCRRSTRRSHRSRTRPTSAEFWPYLRDADTLARPVGRARHPRPRAPHRRPGEGRRARATSPTSPRTTTDDAAARGEDRRHPGARPRGRRSDGRRRAAGRRLGLHVRPDRGGRAAGAGAGAQGRHTPTCGTSTRCRGTSAKCWRVTESVLVPEMNLGQLSLLLRGPLPRGREELHEGLRSAV